MVSVPDLPVDSGRDSRTEEDILGMEEVVLLYSRFAQTVKECDPHGRIVGSRRSKPARIRLPRLPSTNFGTDTLAQHREMLAALNPDGMGAVCMHRYADGVRLPITPGN